jgi:DNA-binding MurR/RpiR family transcriptional regulator
MHNSSSLHQIKRRAEAINLSLTEMARRAKVSPSTVTRNVRGLHETKSSIERRLEETLMQHELRLRDYLLSIHPVAEKPARAPADQTAEAAA